MENESEKNKITNYFTLKKTVEWVDVPIEQTGNSTENFYKESILERVVEIKCSTTDCANRKLELTNKLKEEKEKLENLKKALESCQFIIEEKNKKISQLRSAAEESETQAYVAKSFTPSKMPKTTKMVTTPEVTPLKKDTSKSSLRTPPAMVSPSTAFSAFRESFSSKQLAQLRSFDQTMRDDSKFILLVMRSLYQDNLNELKGMNN